MPDTKTPPNYADPAQNAVHEEVRFPLDPRLGFGKNGSGSSAVMTLLKNVKIGADLTKISAPMKYARGQSGLELKAISTRPTKYLLEMHTIEDPVLRMEAFVKNVLVNLCSSLKDTFVHTKPYNPVLGEVFKGTWEDEDSSTVYIAEQVSHHPPISSEIIYNLKKKFISHSCVQMKMVLKDIKLTCQFEMVGQNQFHLLSHNETYDITGPGMAGTGLLFGSAKFEPSGTLLIVNEKENLRAKIKFPGKHKVEGKIQRIVGKKKTLLKTLKGNFLGTIEMTDKTSGSGPGAKNPEWYNVDNLDWGSEPNVAPVHEQEEYESRRVWHNATYELFANKDEEAAQKCKEQVEEHQRTLAKKRKQTGPDSLPAFEPQFFDRVQGEQVAKTPVYRYKYYDDLVRSIMEKNDAEEEDEDLD